MADWDDDDFVPTEASSGAVVKGDKWEGEDEDDDVKDAWDAESEEENSQKDSAPGEDGASKAVQRKKKKRLADIIAEKEEAKSREMEEQLKNEEAKKVQDTPEAKLAEKLRLQKLEEVNNLELAKEMLGLGKSSIDTMIPVTPEEFQKFGDALTEKISSFENSEHYQDFVENLITKLCTNLNTATLKKVRGQVDVFHSVKLKEEKAAKSKKGKPNKANLKIEHDKDLFGGAMDEGGYDDLDDFM